MSKILLPHDVDAESMVLGSILVDNFKLSTARTILEPADFYVPAHQFLFQAFCDIKSTVIDLITIKEAIGEKEFKKIGEDKLVELSPLFVEGEIFDEHCNAVLEYSIRRQLIRVFSAAASECQGGEKTSEDIISAVAAKIVGLNKTRQPVKKLRDLMKKAMLLFEDGANRKEGETNFELAVPTGLFTVDRELTAGGIPRGLVCSIAAESSKGKSALGVSVCRGAAKRGQKILVSSFEDSELSVAIRLISQESGIENRTLQRCHPNDNDFGTIVQSINSMWDCMIDFIAPRQVDQLCSQILAENMRTRYDMVLIDYLQTVPSGLRSANRQEHVDHCFSAINSLARQMPGTATVLISQLSRIHGRRPSITNLYHSGQIEQGSRTVILIWDPIHLVKEGARVIDIAKQHNGPKREVIVGFKEENVLFHDITDDKISRLTELLADAKKYEEAKK